MTSSNPKGNSSIRKWIRYFGRASACGLILGCSYAIAQTSSLPELGDSSAQHLSAIQEAAIGKEFYRSLVGDPDFVNDYELRSYIQTLGDSVGEYAELRGIPLTFSLISDNTLNAFAVPGGYISFFTGLVMATESESELASVMGHEIAHITQRHLPRLLAKQDEQRIPALAALVASILIGGQAGLAGVAATNAAVLGNQLSYSRQFEQEADAIGIQLLANAQYDPNAMAGFFSKLEKFTRHESTEIPPFLKTHPVSYTRVAESEIRASDYPLSNYQDSFEYYLARARIRTLFVEREDNPLLFFNDQLGSPVALERLAARYGIALAKLENRQFDQANEALAPLTEAWPTQPWIQVLQASIEEKSGNLDAAVVRLEKLLEANPDTLFVSYYLALAHLENNQPELATKVLRYQIRRNQNDFVLYQLIADAYGQSGQLIEARQAEAEYNAILGNYERAVSILKQALRETGGEGYLGQSIKARIPELEAQARFQKEAVKL